MLDEDVSITIEGSCVYNETTQTFTLHTDNTVPETAGFRLADTYPSANFTTGFRLNLTNYESASYTTDVAFSISFKDATDALQFNLYHNSTQTRLQVNMINDDTTYTLYDGIHPTLYPCVNKMIRIKYLNQYLWFNVDGTDWITKLDLDAHPLNLTDGIIYFYSSAIYRATKHDIDKIYFEPIVVFQDDVVFLRSIYAEQYEQVKVDEVVNGALWTYQDYTRSNIYHKPISGTGNVGIGTTNPLQKLHIEGNTYTSGNIGIGTTNPQYPLHVVGAIKADSYIGITQQIQSDWNQTNISSLDYIKNKPVIVGNSSNETITTPWISLNSNITSTINIPSNSNILATNYTNTFETTCVYDNINKNIYVGFTLYENNTLAVKNLDQTSTSITIPSHTNRQYIILKYDDNGIFKSWTTIRHSGVAINGDRLKIFKNYLYFLGTFGASATGATAYHFSTTSSLGSSPFTTTSFSYGVDSLVVKYDLSTATAHSWWTSGIIANNNDPYQPNSGELYDLIVDNNNNLFAGMLYASHLPFTTNRFNTTSTVGTKSTFTLPASSISTSTFNYIIIQFDSSGIPIKWTNQEAFKMVSYNTSMYVAGTMNNIYNFTSTTLGTIVKYLGGESGIVKYDTTTGNAISWTSSAGAIGISSLVMDNLNNLYWTFRGSATGIYDFYTTTKPSSSGSINANSTGIVKFTNDTVSNFLQTNVLLRALHLYTDIANNLYLSAIVYDEVLTQNYYTMPSFNPYSKTINYIRTNNQNFVVKWKNTGEILSMLDTNCLSYNSILGIDDALNIYFASDTYNVKFSLNEFGVNSTSYTNIMLGTGSGEENYIMKYNERGQVGNYNIAYYLPPCALNIYNEKNILIDNRNDVNLTIIGSNLDGTRTVESFDITNKSIKANWIYDKYVLSGQHTNYINQEKASIVNSLNIDYNCLYVGQNGNIDGLKVIDASQFYRRTANSSAITTTLTNVFGVSPFITINSFYNFEYNIIFTNSTTGAITLGWNSVNIGTGYIYAIVKVIRDNATSTSITTTTFNSTTNKAIGGGSTGTYLMTIKGFLLTNQPLYLPLVIRTSAGNITILKGSHFKLTNRGYTASIGNIL